MPEELVFERHSYRECGKLLGISAMQAKRYYEQAKAKVESGDQEFIGHIKTVVKKITQNDYNTLSPTKVGSI